MALVYDPTNDAAFFNEAKERMINLEYALEQGSRYKAFKNDQSGETVDYVVVNDWEKGRFEEMPTILDYYDEETINYNELFTKQIDIAPYIVSQGVTDVWLFMKPPEYKGLYESNMSSPAYGTHTNGGVYDGLPEFANRTYTVFGLNSTRGLDCDLENYIHHFEWILKYAQNPSLSEPESKTTDSLFWGNFVGSNPKDQIFSSPMGAGWAHLPPNARYNYDNLENKRYVSSTIGNWNPDGIGKIEAVNSDTWMSLREQLSLPYPNLVGENDSSYWKIYWLQNIPGANNGLLYNGKKITNWWNFVTDFQSAMKQNQKLFE